MKNTEYVVRKGKEYGKGLYARIEGCICHYCVKWVDERDDATRFSKNGISRRVAAEGNARVVRVIKSSPKPNPHAGKSSKQLQKELDAKTKALDIAERRLAGEEICKHGIVHCIECEKRCVDCGDEGYEERDGRRLCENCIWDEDNNPDD